MGIAQRVGRATTGNLDNLRKKQLPHPYQPADTLITTATQKPRPSYLPTACPSERPNP